MSINPAQSKVKKIINFAKFTFVLPVLLVSVVLGGFGGSIVYGVNEVTNQIANFAAVNLGYGCGGYGQSAPATSFVESSPTYGNACVQQLVTSSSSTPASNTTTLNLKVNLAGGYSDTNDSNSTTLRTGNKIPLSQPYNVAPWSYTGSESVSNASDIPTTATDWILVEVKDASGASVLKKAGFLLGNGNVVDTTIGATSLSLGNLATGSYKVVVRHRNHIAIATDVNVSLTANTSTTVDLTKNVNVKAGNQVLVGTDSTGANVYGMRNANVNSDSVINATDKGLARLASATTLYSKFDVNLDGVVNATDKVIVRLATAAAESL